MNEPITEAKLFEMFGRVSMERDLQREAIMQLQRELAEHKKSQKEDKIEPKNK